MDWSPIWISMKTATLSIIITFFLGVWMARLVVSARSEKVKMVLDGILTVSYTHLTLPTICSV